MIRLFIITADQERSKSEFEVRLTGTDMIYDDLCRSGFLLGRFSASGAISNHGAHSPNSGPFLTFEFIDHLGRVWMNIIFFRFKSRFIKGDDSANMPAGINENPPLMKIVQVKYKHTLKGLWCITCSPYWPYLRIGKVHGGNRLWWNGQSIVWTQYFHNFGKTLMMR